MLRTLLLWSREPWDAVDDVGLDSMQPRRFASVVTKTSIGEVTVVGVCVPWFGSGSRTGPGRGQERRGGGKTTSGTWPVSPKSWPASPGSGSSLPGTSIRLSGLGSRNLDRITPSADLSVVDLACRYIYDGACALLPSTGSRSPSTSRESLVSMEHGTTLLWLLCSAALCRRGG